MNDTIIGSYPSDGFSDSVCRHHWRVDRLQGPERIQTASKPSVLDHVAEFICAEVMAGYIPAMTISIRHV